jgi:hypothetical protein
MVPPRPGRAGAACKIRAVPSTFRPGPRWHCAFNPCGNFSLHPPGRALPPPQLESVAAQTHADWRIWVSDDHSTDGTLDVLQHYRFRQWGEERLSWVRGPGRGFVANFLTLACIPKSESAYYAFCDQDDLWDPDKLEVALAWVTSRPRPPPCRVWRPYPPDRRGRPRDRAVAPVPAPHVLRQRHRAERGRGQHHGLQPRPARDLLVEAGPDLDIQTHDWWLYILATGCGGCSITTRCPRSAIASTQTTSSVRTSAGCRACAAPTGC